MAKQPEVPAEIEEEFEDDPQLRKLFKSYLREAMDEFFAENEEEDKSGAGSRDGVGGTEAGDRRAETSQSKTKQIRSIFSKR